MGFDFNQAFTEGEAFHPSARPTLEKGSHVVKIENVEGTTSSGGYPMIKLRVGNDEGKQSDNLVISPKEFSVKKVVGLIEAAGLARPEAEDVDHDGRLSDSYLQRLNGKTVGIVVRDEEDREEKGKFWPRVQGYVAPSVLNADVPIDTSDLPIDGDFGQTSLVNDDDIPF